MATKDVTVRPEVLPGGTSVGVFPRLTTQPARYSDGGTPAMPASSSGTLSAAGVITVTANAGDYSLSGTVSSSRRWIDFTVD